MRDRWQEGVHRYKPEHLLFKTINRDRKLCFELDEFSDFTQDQLIDIPYIIMKFVITYK